MISPMKSSDIDELLFEFGFEVPLLRFLGALQSQNEWLQKSCRYIEFENVVICDMLIYIIIHHFNRKHEKSNMQMAQIEEILISVI